MTGHLPEAHMPGGVGGQEEDEMSQVAKGGTASFCDELCCLRGFPLKGALVR